MPGVAAVNYWLGVGACWRRVRGWVLLRAGMTMPGMWFSGWVRVAPVVVFGFTTGLGALAGRMSQGVYFPLCGSLVVRVGLCCLCFGSCAGVLFSLVLFACV